MQDEKNQKKGAAREECRTGDKKWLRKENQNQCHAVP